MKREWDTGAACAEWGRSVRIEEGHIYARKRTPGDTSRRSCCGVGQSYVRVPSGGADPAQGHRLQLCLIRI